MVCRAALDEVAVDRGQVHGDVLQPVGRGHVGAQLPEHAGAAGALDADDRGLAGVQVGEVRGRVAERPVLAAQADRRKKRVDAALERVEVGRAAGAGPVLGLQRAREDDADGLGLVREHRAGLGRVRRRGHRLVPQVDLADLEEVRRVVEPVHVVAHGCEESGQQHGAHHRLLDAHRVRQPDGLETDVAVGQPERSEGVRRDERVGDHLVEAAAGQGAPDGTPHLLRPSSARRRCVCRGSVSGARP